MATKARKTTATAPRATAAAEPPAAAVAADAHWAAKRARLSNRRRAEQRLRICDDQDVQRRLSFAEMALAAARVKAREEHDRVAVPFGMSDEDFAAAREEFVTAETAREALAVEELRKEEAAASIELVFRALGSRAFEDLVRDHPASAVDAEAGMEFDKETFPPALIAACHVERDADGVEVPGMTPEDAAGFLTEWSQADASALFAVPWSLNQSMRVDLGKGS